MMCQDQRRLLILDILSYTFQEKASHLKKSRVVKSRRSNGRKLRKNKKSKIWKKKSQPFPF